MRGHRNYNNLHSTPVMGERLIAVLSYLTAGMVGFFWIILAHFTKKTLRPFIKFHAFQAIFISLLYYVASIFIGILLAFVKVIPFIGSFVLSIVFYIAHFPVVFGYSILHFAMFLVILYLVATAASGKFSNLPWISDTIKRMI